VATGKEAWHLTGQHDEIDATVIAFSPDGRWLAAGSLVWDTAGRPRGVRPLTRALAPEELGMLWEALAGADGPAAYRAIGLLARAPDQSVPFLRARLAPAPPLDARPERIARLVADLGSGSFKVRDRATTELEGVGDVVAPALREALRSGLPPEAQQRVRRLLARINNPPPPARLRELRAVEVLEHIGTPEARQVLEMLTKGAAEARLTREACASLGRLTKRLAPVP
jgi:hypothetical protein